MFIQIGVNIIGNYVECTSDGTLYLYVNIVTYLELIIATEGKTGRYTYFIVLTNDNIIRHV